MADQRTKIRFHARGFMHMPNHGELVHLGEAVLAGINAIVDAYILRVRALPGYGEDKVPQQSLAASTTGLMSLLISATVIDKRALGPELMEGTKRATKVRAEEGVPVESMMRALHIGADELWRGLEQAADRLSIPSVVARRASAAMQDGISEMMTWVATAYAEFDLDRSREDHRRRERVFQDILQGTATEARLLAHGLTIEETYLPIRARAMAATNSADMERTLLRFAAEHGGLVTSVAGDVAGILVGSPPHLADALIGVGPPSLLAQIARGFQLASRILETATAFGLHGRFDLAALGARVAIHAELELGATVMAQYVTPVTALGEFGRQLLTTVEAFIRNGMRHETTAQWLHIHRNTLRYRLDRYAELTGADLRSGEDLMHVWWALQRRLIDGEQPRSRGSAHHSVAIGS